VGWWGINEINVANYNAWPIIAKIWGLLGLSGRCGAADLSVEFEDML